MQTLQECFGVPKRQNPPWSSIIVDSGNGHGSSSSKIRRFSNIRQNLGTDIQYTDDAALGASFKVTTQGVYYISYNDASAGTTTNLGITVNDTAPTTSIVAPLTYAQGMRAYSQGQSASTDHVCVTWCGPLYPGDVVRAHTDGIPSETDSRCMLTITRVA